MSTLDQFETGSLIRVRSTRERGKVIGIDEQFLLVEFPKSETARLLPSEVRYLGTPGVDCAYMSDYDQRDDE